MKNISKIINGVVTTHDSDLSEIAEAHAKRRSLVKKTAYDGLRRSHAPLKLAALITEASRGDHVAVGRLREAVSSSDFPLLFGQVTQTAMLGQYADLPQQWPAFSLRQVVPDFRPARLLRWDTALEQLPASNGGYERHVRALPRIPELTEYPTFSLTAESQEYFVNKYGARFPFSWEAFLNDEMGVIQQLPSEMARWARDTEDLLTTGVLATSAGPNPDFFDPAIDFGNQVPAGNFVPGNPALSIESLEQAIQYIRMRQVNGRSVQVPNFVLLVPPALALTAQEIVAATTYTRVQVDPLTNDEIRFNVSSPISGQFTVQVNEWLPLIDQSANAATTWYLVPSGGRTQRGPAIVTAFLRGNETPELRIMGDTGRGVTGGAEVPALAGSFSHDDIQYRVRTVIGAAGLDNSPVAVSRGTGTDES